MYYIKRLDVEDAVRHKKNIVRFIYESVKNTSYEDSYLPSDAESKYEDMLSHMAKGNAVVFGAIADEEMIGFIWGYEYPFRDDKSRLYVSVLHVDERFRGRKVGKNLLSEIEGLAKNLGYHSVFLHAEAFNSGAIRFYDRMGYQAERIQLVKKDLHINENNPERKSLGIQKTDSNQDGGVKRITFQQACEYREELAELFWINTKAHILTQYADYHLMTIKIVELAEYIRHDKAVVYGYFDKKQIVGFIWVFPYKHKKEERYFLNAITVLPEYRKKHIASILFESVEKELYCKNKALALFTFVDAVNENGCRFYQKHGMKEEVYQLVKNIC